MTNLIRRVRPDTQHGPEISREWLVTNGLGGFASGTLSGPTTRRYHGVLVAALPAPLGRMVMLSHVQARVRFQLGTTWLLDLGMTVANDREVPQPAPLEEFRLEQGLPVWRYRIDGAVVEKRVIMPHRQNSTYVTYTILEGPAKACLELRPFMHVRHYESPLRDGLPGPYSVTAKEDRFEVVPAEDMPALRLRIHGPRATLTLSRSQFTNGYLEERSRGYPFDGALWSPGFFQLDLDEGVEPREATLIASTEPWETVEALQPHDALSTELQRRDHLLQQAVPTARSGLAAELVLAADQFIIVPSGRTEAAARALALGTELRTVIAGYHWFTDWGRDTMISLEGLMLLTGRAREAAYTLQTFAAYARDGLIPNMFPDGEREGLYHTADASLWFFHAVDRYVSATGDRDTLRALLPTLQDIIDHHVRGTRFGIGIDPRDGLLRQGAEGYQLTWMDAKVGDWVVTPRRGKAVEINALFYNALRLLERWMREEHGEESAAPLGRRAEQARASFNARFWYDAGQYLYDVVDGETGDDPSCRPNQILAISLANPVLAAERWRPVFDVVRSRLLTPFGLRSLAPGHKDYQPQYYGDLRARDAAYHQGTVWAWLIGPMIDAWLRVLPGEPSAIRSALEAFDAHLSAAGMGTVNEIFDAEKPYTPRGCIAQAWSVAEVLRAWLLTTPTPSDSREELVKTDAGIA
jgi:predicted glycogen debranching enzyme